MCVMPYDRRELPGIKELRAGTGGAKVRSSVEDTPSLGG